MSTVVYLHNALVPRRVLSVAPCSIRSLAPTDAPHPYVAFVDGVPVLRADWETVLTHEQALAFVDVHALPQGGGGGSDPLRTIAIIALMVYAPQFAAQLSYSLGGGMVLGSAAGLSALSAGIVVGGMALINTVMPPPKPTSAQQAASLAAPSPTYSLQAQGNSARLEAAIPEHFGRMLAYPDFAAMPYAEFVGNDQYLFQLLCIGRGEYSIEKIRIEDSDINNFTDVTVEVVGPNQVLDLFPANVITSIEVAGQDLIDTTPIGPFVANQSGTTCNYLGFDFVMARGLYFASDDGSLGTKVVELKVEVQQINDAGVAVGGWVNLSGATQFGDWSDWVVFATGSLSGTLPADTLSERYRIESNTVVYGGQNIDREVTTFTKFRSTRPVSFTSTRFEGATTTAQRKSVRFAVAPGRYQARVSRLDVKDTSTRAGHDAAWVGMRAYINDARTYGDVTLLALRMKATSNLSNQSSRKINVIATRKLPTWNGSTWSAPVATRSIAAAFAYACHSVGLTDAQLDLAGLSALDATWAARGDYFDARFDNFLSFWEAATKVAQAGRAKPYMQGGVMRVARDQAASIPVAMFSMRNIVKGSFKVSYLMPTDDTADSVRATYFDGTTLSAATVTATLPGSTADNIAKVNLFGVTDRAQAYREAMYTAAANRFRRRIISFTTEMEGFIPSFLDLINVQHDMPGWGQGGEVLSWDSGTRVLTVSEPVNFLDGSNHYVALRKRDGSVSGPYLVTEFGTTGQQLALVNDLDFVPYVGHTEERTHYSFGWAETFRQRARVLSAKPLSLTQVAIECAAEDDNVHTADLGIITPPVVTSQLSGFVNAPTVLALSAVPVFFNQARMLVTWEPSPWATSYVVEQSADDIHWTLAGTTTTSTLECANLYGASTLVRVAAINVSQGAWSQVGITVEAPPDVAGLIYSDERLSWTALIAGNVSGYKIKYHYGSNLDWGVAHDLHTGILTGSPYIMATRPVGTVTLMIKAVESLLGLESATAAHVIVNLGDALVANVVESKDYEALGWPGAITGGAVVGGAVLADQPDDFYLADAAQFYGLSGAEFYTSNYGAMQYLSGGLTPSTTAVGSRLTAAWTIAGDSLDVQYRETGPGAFYADDLADFYAADAADFYGPPGAWIAWPGAIDAAPTEYQWRFATAAGPTQGNLSAFVVSVDVPDLLLRLNNVLLAPAGTRLTDAAGRFAEIQNVQLTLQGGSTATYLEITDKSAALGPLITAKNAAGTGVAATVDAFLQGY